ncbi:MAG: Nif3-like dinuclear metal center hexameric protein [Saprospiraceae bacterium]|nr:Nif3-like dinuclear metal center hexameric protein [Saprospiraceae bacterium]
MPLNEVCHFLEEVAPLHLQETYDNAGLICGNPNWDIKGALISLDATEEVIDEAIQMNCNLVISHHPIVFKGLKSFQGLHYVERAIIKAIKNDIALYSIHTNLDNVLYNGVNQKIADILGLTNVQILSPKSSAEPKIGSGVIGDLKSSLPIQDLLELLKIKFNGSSIRHTRITKNHIQKIAICGGSGSFLIPYSIRSAADVYITSDIKYHEFFEANDQLILIDIGHFESEQFTIQLLFDLISKKYPNFAAHCTKTNTNPVQYF